MYTKANTFLFIIQSFPIIKELKSFHKRKHYRVL